MHVVLDTNSICSDYQLRGTAFYTLLEGIKRVSIILHVPQIVIDEAISNYKEAFEGFAVIIASFNGRIKNLPFTLDDARIKAETESYTQLLSKKLSDVGATIGHIHPSPTNSSWIVN
ncbi:MAG: DUF4935 domain-containing protein [Actinobacteria bacterium]|nr:DUF4935 domain-containing protein [Actinomycetota bacterium]